MKTLISRLDHGTRLSTAVVVVIAVTLIPLVIALWPHQPSTTGTTYPSAVLSDVSYTDCENVTDEVPCGQATGTLNTGHQVEVMLFRDAWLSHASNDDRAILYASNSPDSDTVYTFHSHDRAIKLAIFTIIVIIVVLLVIGGKGIRAIASLLASALFIWAFLIGGISTGGSPLLYTTVSIVLVLTAVLFFTHGLSTKTLAAWAGTMCGAATAMIAGSLLSSWLRLGPADESASALTYTSLDIDLSALSLAALLIALIGILNDIAAAQAATVFSHTTPGTRPNWKAIAPTALAVGRDHSASAIYTISFSIVGAGLAAFVLAHAYNQPLSAFLQTDTVATTLTQMLAGIIGIIITMPATTAFALVLSRIPTKPQPLSAHTH
ncbi:YibE/F family protein [Brevibacterium linens]|uniref:YibE/F-like protein n=1 Tax=Brevibacterium linens ATCC 9172 TaxID=1255617 RepID=A0A2H1KRJ9_BRELN|nr:YibE/F family protein [Brevibacterium linens]KAB1942251.1 YibE/F family protein [Brevibacterium linens ATCC 9172]SMY02386.1 YibE/F-like protein [Brevibacterium linens ATCC 9172]